MIGEVQHIWITRGYHGPEDRGDWFWDPMENGGGAIMDYGSHAVSSVWFLAGYDKSPDRVRSLGIEARQKMRLIGGRFQQIETDDDAHFKVRFVNPKNGDPQYAVSPGNLDAELQIIQSSGITVKTVSQALDELLPQL